MRASLISVLLTLLASTTLLGSLFAQEGLKQINIIPKAGGDQSYWAIVVGISDYDDYEHFPSLPAVKNDVDALVAALTTPERGGVFKSDQVFVLSSSESDPQSKPTRSNVARVLHVVEKLAGPNDLILFFFSGHGCISGGENHLILSDSSYNDEDRTLERTLKLSDVLYVLKSCPANRIVTIVDACHSGVNPKKSMNNNLGTDVAREAAVAEMTERGGKGVVVISSSSSEQKSGFRKEGDYSVFTYNLVKGMQGDADSNGDRFVSCSELYDYVHKQTLLYSAQTGDTQEPWISATVGGDILLSVAGDIRDVTSRTGNSSAPPSSSGGNAGQPQLQPAQPSYTVAIDGTGKYDSINEALAKEPDGSELKLGPGVFNEQVTVRTSHSIRGAGKDATIIQSSDGEATVYFIKSASRLSDVTIKRTSPGNAITIEQGSPTLSNVAATGALEDDTFAISPSGSGILVKGAYGDMQSRPMIEDCETYGNEGWGLCIWNYSLANVSGCEIHGNFGGVEVGGYKPLVTGNHIYGNTQYGLFVSGNSGGTYTNNRIENNGLAGINALGSIGAVFQGNTSVGNGQPDIFTQADLNRILGY